MCAQLSAIRYHAVDERYNRDLDHRARVKPGAIFLESTGVRVMNGVRLAVMILLAFLGVGALVGAVPMILWPLQTQWNLLPVTVLQYSPFHSFLIPGIILLVVNGILASWVLWLVLARKSLHGLWTAFQGCVLLGWLVIECWMIRAVGLAHYFYALIAMALIVLGFAMWSSTVPQPATPR